MAIKSAEIRCGELTRAFHDNDRGVRVEWVAHGLLVVIRILDGARVQIIRENMFKSDSRML